MEAVVGSPELVPPELVSLPSGRWARRSALDVEHSCELPLVAADPEIRAGAVWICGECSRRWELTEKRIALMAPNPRDADFRLNEVRTVEGSFWRPRWRWGLLRARAKV